MPIADHALHVVPASAADQSEQCTVGRQDDAVPGMIAAVMVTAERERYYAVEYVSCLAFADLHVQIRS
jgi:hypothetical protein